MDSLMRAECVDECMSDLEKLCEVDGEIDRGSVGGQACVDRCSEVGDHYHGLQDVENEIFWRTSKFVGLVARYVFADIAFPLSILSNLPGSEFYDARSGPYETGNDIIDNDDDRRKRCEQLKQPAPESSPEQVPQGESEEDYDETFERDGWVYDAYPWLQNVPDNYFEQLHGAEFEQREKVRIGISVVAPFVLLGAAYSASALAATSEIGILVKGTTAALGGVWTYLGLSSF